MVIYWHKIFTVAVWWCSPLPLQRVKLVDGLSFHRRTTIIVANLVLFLVRLLLLIFLELPEGSSFNFVPPETSLESSLCVSVRCSLYSFLLLANSLSFSNSLPLNVKLSFYFFVPS